MLQAFETFGAGGLIASWRARAPAAQGQTKTHFGLVSHTHALVTVVGGWDVLGHLLTDLHLRSSRVAHRGGQRQGQGQGHGISRIVYYTLLYHDNKLMCPRGSPQAVSDGTGKMEWGRGAGESTSNLECSRRDSWSG